MISYLSRPIAPGVIPEQAPIELIAQVAQQKQAKYDTVLTSILAQYDNLLNLDTSAGSHEATDMYNQLMVEANKNIASLAKLDLMNPDNASKIDNVFAPILNNRGIMTAVAETRRVQKELAVDDHYRLKQPDKYSAKNRQYLLERVQQNREMTMEQFETDRYTPVASLFFDLKKDLVEQAKNLEITDHVVVTQDGFYVVTKKDGIKTQEEIMQFLTLDSRHYQQAEIDAYFNYQQTAPEEILGATLKRFDSEGKLYQTVINLANEDLKIIQSSLDRLGNQDDDAILSASDREHFSNKYNKVLSEQTTVGQIRDIEQGKKDRIERNKNSHAQALNRANERKNEMITKYGIQVDPTTGAISLAEPLNPKVVDGLKTNFYLQEVQSQVAQGMKVHQQSLEIKRDDYAFENHKLKNKIIEMQLQADIDALTAQYGGRTGTPNNPSEPPTPTFIPVPGGTIDQTVKEEFTEQTMLQDAQNISANINDITNQYAEYLAESGDERILNFASLSPEKQEEYKTKAGVHIDAIKAGYDAFYLQDSKSAIITGTEPITKEEFDKLYGEAIPFYERLRNNEASRDIIMNLHNSIKSSVQPQIINKNSDYYKQLLKNEVFIDPRTGKYSNTPSNATVKRNYLEMDDRFSPVRNQQGNKFKVLFSEEVMKDIAKGGELVVNLKQIYEYNLTQRNIPLKSESTDAGEIIYKPLTSDEFIDWMSSQEVSTGLFGGRDLPGFKNTDEEIAEQFKLLSRTTMPSGFTVIKGTGAANILFSYANSAPDSKGNKLPLNEKDTSLVIYQPPGESNLVLRATTLLDPVKKTTEVRDFPVTPQLRQLLGGQLEEVSSILEIERGLDYMMRFMEAYNNPAFKLNKVKAAIPENMFHYRGNQYKVFPISNTHIKVVSTKPGGKVHIVTPSEFMEYIVNDGMTSDQRKQQELQYQKGLLFQNALKQIETSR